MFYGLLTLLLILVALNTHAQQDNAPQAISNADIENQAIHLANRWNDAWNGEINIDSMMLLHHPDLLYYWHGKPMTYESFKDVLKNYVIGIETYDNELINPEVTILDRDNAIVSFQLIARGAEPESAEGALTLVITRVGTEWKIIHIHEG